MFDLLSSLVDKSLLAADFERREPRYRLLESFREYAREKLGQRGEQEMVARRHARAYLEIAERADAAWDTEGDLVWSEPRDPDLDNWRAALEWALVARGDVALGQRLASASIMGLAMRPWKDAAGSPWRLISSTKERRRSCLRGSIMRAQSSPAYCSNLK